MKFLIFVFFASSAFASTNFDIDAEGVHPRQLASIKAGELRCENSALEVQALFEVLTAEENADGRMEFTGKLILKTRLGGGTLTELHPKNQSLNWILHANVDAANRAYRGQLNLADARRALFDRELQMFVMSADGLRISINTGAEIIFHAESSTAKEIILSASGVYVETGEADPQFPNDEGRQINQVNGLTHCSLKIEFRN